MSTTFDRTQQIASSLDDKAYAEAFVDAEITTTLPFQLREMRKGRGWKQQDVANRINGNQKTISDFENPNYARYTLKTLKKLAAVYDVALIVRFAPFSELVDWAATLTHGKLAVPERRKDARLKKQRAGKKETTSTTSDGLILMDLPMTDVTVNASGDSTTILYAPGQDEPPATAPQFMVGDAA